jgi:hypothetical protein
MVVEAKPPIATEGILVLDPYSLPPITSKKKPNASGPPENINCLGEQYKNI